MNSKAQGSGAFQGAGWVVGSVSLVLIISAGGLELLAQQTLGQASVAAILLTLFLAFWSYVLGLVGLLFLSVRWLVSWRRVRVKRAALSRYAHAELRSRRLVEPEPANPQFLQQGVAPNVPSRSSRDTDDRNEVASPSRVA
ncbi:MAG: hypothetical protein ACREIH_07350 [Nitrospiraceae bacterium]